MTKKIVVSILFVLSNAALAANQIVVQIEGMDCDKCAQALEKKFSSKTEVKSVQVSFAEKLMQIELKPDQNMTDEALTALITQSGLKATKVERK